MRVLSPMRPNSDLHCTPLRHPLSSPAVRKVSLVMTHANLTRGPDAPDSAHDIGKRVRRTRSITAEDRERLRQLILECALREFAQKGYENTSIDTVAERAGVGKGTVYRY